VTHLGGGLDKGIPFDSGKETTKKVRIEVAFAKSKLDVGKFKWEVVGSATLDVTCKKIMGDQTDHDRTNIAARKKTNRDNPVRDRAGGLIAAYRDLQLQRRLPLAVGHYGRVSLNTKSLCTKYMIRYDTIRA